jgi:hypothetical protein
VRYDEETGLSLTDWPAGASLVGEQPTGKNGACFELPPGASAYGCLSLRPLPNAAPTSTAIRLLSAASVRCVTQKCT